MFILTILPVWLFQPFFTSLETGNVRVSVTPLYKMDSSMVSRDGMTLTSEAVCPYLDFLAGEIEEILVRFDARRVPSAEIVLDDTSSHSTEVPKVPSIPSTPMVPSTPEGGGFDSSLTLPEFYATPPSNPGPSVPKSGVSIRQRTCFF